MRHLPLHHAVIHVSRSSFTLHCYLDLSLKLHVSLDFSVDREVA